MTTPTAGPAEIARAVEILRRGGLVAFPTETVYGLGADALNPRAVDRIFQVKGRPVSHPLIVHLASAGDLGAWAAEVPDAARRLAGAFWPGPLTLILRRASNVPDAVTGGQDTVGVRVPAHPVAQALLEAFGSGIAAPSANRFGRISPTRAEHVRADLGGDVDLVLEGGPSRVGIESTIVDVSRERVTVLRPGHVTTRMLSEVLGVQVEGLGHFRSSGDDVDAGELESEEDRMPRAPGTLAAHYAPQTPLELIERVSIVQRLDAAPAGTRYGVVFLGIVEGEAPRSQEGAHVVIRLPGDPDGVARELYATLRRLDTVGAAAILVEEPPRGSAWDGVRDRLRRAAATFR